MEKAKILRNLEKLINRDFGFINAGRIAVVADNKKINTDYRLYQRTRKHCLKTVYKEKGRICCSKIIFLIFFIGIEEMTLLKS